MTITIIMMTPQSQGFGPYETNLQASRMLWPLWKDWVHLGRAQKVEVLTWMSKLNIDV